MTDPNTPQPEQPAQPGYPSAQPAYPPAQPGYQQPYAPQYAPGDYPGKTLGIVGLVFVFVFWIVGIILSHIAYSQSKAAGFQNTPAKVGIIVGWILFGLGVLTTILFFAIFIPLGIIAWNSGELTVIPTP